MRIAFKMAVPLVIAAVLGLATVAVIAPRVSALNDENQTSEDEQEKHEKEEELRQKAKEKAAKEQAAKEQAAQKLREKEVERKDAVKTKLEDAKLRVCQKREANINSIMKRIGNRGQTHLNLITRIAEQAEKFYTDHDKIVANYDALVADVEAKKAAAQAAVDAAKSSSVAFKCDGTDPKGAAASFKEKQSAQHEALKAYKTSVKNLIAAIRTAHKSAQGGQE